ncbi:MAG: hypothetical protein IPJ65_07005 [Archangiaceae bacterium]|nr:hypothetical protein [Archangiaceae bacterium]
MSALLSLLLTAAPLPGGALLHEHLPGALATARVGEWVTYRFDGGGDRVYFWRIAVVGEQVDSRGRPAVWVELDVGTHPAMKSPITSMKVLAARATGMSAEGVTRLMVAYGVERPRELEPSELPAMLGRTEKAERAAPPKGSPPLPQVQVKRGAPSRLLTLGGTVTATPVEVRLQQTIFKRYWLCDQIPILHLAKMELPAVEHSMEARDWGLDASPQMPAPDPAAATIRMEGAK